MQGLWWGSDKDKVYRIDTELDQIMTFINLCSLFLTRCMDYEKCELFTLFESIFQLEETAFVDSEKKVIELETNPKELALMRKLNKSFCVIIQKEMKLWQQQITKRGMRTRR